jgi:hypothetical protein
VAKQVESLGDELDIGALDAVVDRRRVVAGAGPPAFTMTMMVRGRSRAATNS